MKIILFTLPLLFSLTINAQDKSDFRYDKENASIVPNYLGEVKLIKGNAVAVNKDKKERTLKKKDKIYPEELVKTLGPSFVKIEMVDTTSVTIGKNSEMDFESFKYKTKNDRSMSLRLIKGRMRTHFKLKAKSNNDLKVHVGHVSMGVRGTKILGNVATLSDGRKYASAAVIEGSVKAYDSLFDEMLVIENGQEYFSVTGNNENKKIKKDRKMDDAELKYYRAIDQNPDKYFRPMLKYAKGYIVRNTLPSDQEELSKPSLMKAVPKEEMKQKKTGGWKNTLKKLNQTLKENNGEE